MLFKRMCFILMGAHPFSSAVALRTNLLLQQQPLVLLLHLCLPFLPCRAWMLVLHVAPWSHLRVLSLVLMGICLPMDMVLSLAGDTIPCVGLLLLQMHLVWLLLQMRCPRLPCVVFRLPPPRVCRPRAPPRVLSLLRASLLVVCAPLPPPLRPPCERSSALLRLPLFLLLLFLQPLLAGVSRVVPARVVVVRRRLARRLPPSLFLTPPSPLARRPRSPLRLPRLRLVPPPWLRLFPSRCWALRHCPRPHPLRPLRRRLPRVPFRSA